MLDGFWTVIFESELKKMGAGVFIFQDGNIYGGDSYMIYRGNYKSLGNGQIAGMLSIDKFSDYPEGMGPIMGIDHLELLLSGTFDFTNFNIEGCRVYNKTTKISITGTRVHGIFHDFNL